MEIVMSDNKKMPLDEALKIKAAQVTSILKERYPDAICSLEWHGEPWKLLVMGRLSAQCTDAKVNAVCVELFEKYPTADALACADIEDIERIVRPCGLYRTKAQNIKDECRMLIEDCNGVLPNEMDALLKFPGVGRKIANLVLGDVYKIPGIVADTHCIRICGRLGFYSSDSKDPAKTESVMSAIVEPSEQSDFCHRMVLFGRDVCRSQRPLCNECPLAELCDANIGEKSLH